MRKVLKLQDLECANCAAKMEADISKLPNVQKATISFMTQKLTLIADVDDGGMEDLVDQAQRICASYEPDCEIVR